MNQCKHHAGYAVLNLQEILETKALKLNSKSRNYPPCQDSLPS
jgi:hypothetical protein